jgi:prevent-host-death family protein
VTLPVRRWPLHEAKQHFSELVERARNEGPQVVTKYGKEAVVVVSAEEYRHLRSRSAPDPDAGGRRPASP